jgi:hypothetical protein
MGLKCAVARDIIGDYRILQGTQVRCNIECYKGRYKPERYKDQSRIERDRAGSRS